MSEYRERAHAAIRKIQSSGWGPDALSAVQNAPDADQLGVVFVTRRQAACLIAYLASVGNNLGHMTAAPFEAAAADAYELAASIGEQVFGPVHEPDLKEDS